jgi:hypothetical protein
LTCTERAKRVYVYDLKLFHEAVDFRICQRVVKLGRAHAGTVNKIHSNIFRSTWLNQIFIIKNNNY